MEIRKMTIDYRQLERFFHEARRNAFLVSFFYFFGSVAGLGVLIMLDPELGIAIPILGFVWIAALTFIFLLVLHVFSRPIAKVTEMIDSFFDKIMVDEQQEPVGAGAETEKQQEEKQ